MRTPLWAVIVGWISVLSVALRGDIFVTNRFGNVASGLFLAGLIAAGQLARLVQRRMKAGPSG